MERIGFVKLILLFLFCEVSLSLVNVEGKSSVVNSNSPYLFCKIL